MGTRSAIGYRQPSGAVRAVYVHYDGSPEHQLPILRKRYNTLRKVQDLIRPGSMSSLRTRNTWAYGPSLRDEQGDFVRDAEGLLRYETEQEPGPLYHHERGDGMEPITSNYPANCWDELMDIEHLYVFHPELSYWEHVEQD